MRHRVFVLIVLIMSSIGGSARADSQEQTLVSLTSELRNAIVARDHAALDRLMSANFVLEAPVLGEKVPLKIWLDNTYHYLKLSSFDQTGVSAHVYGNAGVVTSMYSWSGTFHGRPFSASGVLTDTWTQKDNTWTLERRIAYVPGKEPARASSYPSPHPLLLQAYQGEQRVRFPRPGIKVTKLPTFLIKVDSRNGGAENFLMLSEEMQPGAVIPWHRHLHEDEIVYTENGTINARVGDRSATLGPHATVYIPHNTWVTIKNVASIPVRLVAIFDRNNFDAFLRCTSHSPNEASQMLSKSQVAMCQTRGDAQYR